MLMRFVFLFWLYLPELRFHCWLFGVFHTACTNLLIELDLFVSWEAGGTSEACCFIVRIKLRL